MSWLIRDTIRNSPSRVPIEIALSCDAIEPISEDAEDFQL